MQFNKNSNDDIDEDEMREHQRGTKKQKTEANQDIATRRVNALKGILK